MSGEKFKFKSGERVFVDPAKAFGVVDGSVCNGIEPPCYRIILDSRAGDSLQTGDTVTAFESAIKPARPTAVESGLFGAAYE